MEKPCPDPHSHTILLINASWQRLSSLPLSPAGEHSTEMSPRGLSASTGCLASVAVSPRSLLLTTGHESSRGVVGRGGDVLMSPPLTDAPSQVTGGGLCDSVIDQQSP